MSTLIKDDSTNSDKYRYPFEAYPTGWYLIAESSKVKPGQILPLRYFGRDIILFRTESGKAVVADAHCPHMGAHLGYGGAINGENIKCPFHFWEFSSNGSCASIPYQTSDKKPYAELNTWPVNETSGLVFAFFSPTGAEPEWQVPDEPAWGANGWIGYESFQWIAKVHVQEIAENIPDIAHFVYVHDVPTMPKVTGDIKGHVYHQSMTNLVGKNEVKVLTHDAHGLGVAWLEAFIPVHYRLLVAVTPIDEFYSDLRLLFLVEEPEGGNELSRLSRETVDLVVENTSRDVLIWEHKAYIKRPPLVQGDGPIGVLRRWSKQFYQSSAE